MSGTPSTTPYTRGRRWLHVIASILAVGTVLLIAKGGLVHSAGAGLSVPDWPNTYGENMFTFPLEKWTGGIIYEHGHRLIASGIGMLAIVVLVMAWKVDPRRWIVRLAAIALLAVIVQGVLGGLTVLMRLPTMVSVSHALLAQSFMLMAVTLAAATSRSWVTGTDPVRVPVDSGLHRLMTATVVVTFLQILLGAVTRHTYSGMAISDFPLNNGQIIPDFTSFGVAIHFAHRVGALVLTALIITQTVRILRTPELSRLRVVAVLLLVMVLVQFGLGATVIWTREAIIPNTLHVLGGTLTFALAWLSVLRSSRWYRYERTPGTPAATAAGARA